MSLVRRFTDISNTLATHQQHISNTSLRKHLCNRLPCIQHISNTLATSFASVGRYVACRLLLRYRPYSAVGSASGFSFLIQCILFSLGFRVLLQFSTLIYCNLFFWATVQFQYRSRPSTQYLSLCFYANVETERSTKHTLHFILSGNIILSGKGIVPDLVY